MHGTTEKNCIVLLVRTDASEGHVDSVFRVKEIGPKLLLM
jgi:hypothetical protein